jgi:TonB family protein
MMQFARAGIIGALIMSCCLVTAEGETATDTNSDVIVSHFEVLKYPTIAQSHLLEGTVVVRAKLDDSGKVVDVVAISGAESLIPDTLSNVRQWRFKPNANKAALLLFDFRISSVSCETIRDQFAFEDNNFVSVTTCWHPLLSPDKSLQSGHEGTANDSEVVDFEELQYPAIARVARVQGIVVLKVNLDDKGLVASANAISGPQQLVSECITNVKKWRFKPSPAKAAMVIYRFKMPGIGCKSQSSFFTFAGPNFATITGCDVPINTQGS